MSIHRAEGVARPNGDGFALPTVVVVLLLLGVIAIGTAVNAGVDLRASKGMPESARAFYAAEGGLNLMLATWETARYDTLVPNPGDTAVVPWVKLPGSAGSYSGVLQRVDDGSANMIALTVEGRSASPLWSQSLIRVSLVPPAQPDSLFRWAAFGLFYTELNQTLAYGPIGSNGDIEFKSASHLFGDATAVGTVTDPTDVTGTVTEGAAPEPFDPVACPGGPFGPPPPGPGVDFNPATGELKLDSGSDITFPAGTYYFTLLKQSGAGRISIAAGDSVRIYIDGQLSLDGGGVDNHNTARALQIFGCGADASAWQMTGTTNVLAVYAPKHTVKLKGPAAYTGSFIGWEVKKETAGDLRYDPAFGGMAGGSWGGAKVVPGSRTQLSR